MQIAALVTSVTLAGCSLTMARPPSQPRPDVEPDCTESQVRAGMDLAYAIGGAIGLVVAVSQASNPGGGLSSSPNHEVASIGGTSLLTAAAATGVVLGTRWSEQCRAQNDAYDRALAARRAAPVDAAACPALKQLEQAQSDEQRIAIVANLDCEQAQSPPANVAVVRVHPRDTGEHQELAGFLLGAVGAILAVSVLDTHSFP
jgi:hypothetical protein